MSSFNTTKIMARQSALSQAGGTGKNHRANWVAGIAGAATIRCEKKVFTEQMLSSK
jgi:hypothetical protein